MVGVADVDTPRVLLLARELGAGGSERQLCEMARALHGDGFGVHVGAFRPGGMRARELEAHGVPLVEVPLRSFRSVSHVWASIRFLRTYLRTHRISVVHAFDPPTSVLLGLASRFLGSTVVLTSQRSFRGRLPPLFRAGLRLSDRLTDGVVVNCEAIREHLCGDEGVSPGRIHLCYNGLDVRTFRRQAAPLAGVIPPGALVVGTVCNLRPEKDLSTLLQAVAACRAAHPATFLLVVGGGPLRARWEAEALALGLAPHSLFQPATADVVPWLNTMDVFVMPSISEALSNALMEAMACERACVASRVGGNPELVQHGETGLLFECGNVAGLSEQIRTLLDDQALRRRLGCRAAGAIRERFSLSAASHRLAEIYKGEIAKHHALC